MMLIQANINYMNKVDKSWMSHERTLTIKLNNTKQRSETLTIKFNKIKQRSDTHLKSIPSSEH